MFFCVTLYIQWTLIMNLSISREVKTNIYNNLRQETAVSFEVQIILQNHA